MGFLSTPLERAGTLACPAGAPFLGKKWGKEPRGGGSSRDPFSGGAVEGEAVLLTCYLACGLSHWNAGNGPSTGWAGWGRGQVPFGRRERKPFRFPTFPPVNKPLLPPARAGGRAMRRWSWRPQARLQSDQPPSPVFPTREWGSKGKEPPSPLVFFPLFLQRNRAPPGGPSSPPVPTAMEKAPTPCPAGIPHSPSGEVFFMGTA